jgi:hypothetical protein
MVLKSEKYWLLNYNIITIFRLWDLVRKRVYISRNIIFNETELIGNISVGNLPQNTIAPINNITINMFTENKEDKFIAAKIRKIIFKAELPKEIIGIIKISTKFIDIIVSRRNPNIVYENFIEENPILSKVIIAKIIFNENKPSYEIAMASPEIS